MKRIYHSALKEPVDIPEELDFFSDGINTVFKSDIRNIDLGTSPYSDCDVIYTEPSWLDGFEKFISRANAELHSFEEYLLYLSRLIENCTRPLWMVMGTHALKNLPTPHRKEEIKLHGYPTNLLGWNDNESYTFTDNYNFIKQLAENYNCVGDFNCGYGNTGRIFQQAGKNFVMSDINGKCVYYIAKTLMGYDE
jgi:hypothetical protein